MTQTEINALVESIYNILFNGMHKEVEPAKRLRYCTADVFNLDDFYVLRSCNTVVACVDKETGDCYDFLRMVYGYTSTSAQHIAKFRNDYSRSGKTYTWRYISK